MNIIAKVVPDQDGLIEEGDSLEVDHLRYEDNGVVVYVRHALPHIIAKRDLDRRAGPSQTTPPVQY